MAQSSSGIRAQSTVDCQSWRNRVPSGTVFFSWRHYASECLGQSEESSLSWYTTLADSDSFDIIQFVFILRMMMNQRSRMVGAFGVDSVAIGIIVAVIVFVGDIKALEAPLNVAHRVRGDFNGDNLNQFFEVRDAYLRDCPQGSTAVADAIVIETIRSHAHLLDSLTRDLETKIEESLVGQLGCPIRAGLALIHEYDRHFAWFVEQSAVISARLGPIDIDSKFPGLADHFRQVIRDDFDVIEVMPFLDLLSIPMASFDKVLADVEDVLVDLGFPDQDVVENMEAARVYLTEFVEVHPDYAAVLHDLVRRLPSAESPLKLAREIVAPLSALGDLKPDSVRFLLGKLDQNIAVDDLVQYAARFLFERLVSMAEFLYSSGDNPFEDLGPDQVLKAQIRVARRYDQVMEHAQFGVEFTSEQNLILRGIAEQLGVAHGSSNDSLNGQEH